MFQYRRHCYLTKSCQLSFGAHGDFFVFFYTSFWLVTAVLVLSLGPFHLQQASKQTNKKHKNQQYNTYRNCRLVNVCISDFPHELGWLISIKIDTMKDPQKWYKNLHCPLLVGCSICCYLIRKLSRCFLLITPEFYMVTVHFPDTFHLFNAIKAE